jgi:hypothetical protein
MERTSRAVAIQVEDVYNDGQRRVWFVGPFMPHAGSKTTAAAGQLDWDAESIEDLKTRDITVVTLFLGAGESDLPGF